MPWCKQMALRALLLGAEGDVRVLATLEERRDWETQGSEETA